MNEQDCVLCRKYASKIFESKYFFVVYDDFPVRKGHMLIVPIRHVESLNLTPAEFGDLAYVLPTMVAHAQDTFGAEGYNIGINCGEVAGQTIDHLHIHIIPRYPGDVPNPRGGIRNFLPNPLKEYP